MKDTVLDVLLYIFENYMDDDSGISMGPEQVREELGAAGFPDAEVERAFVWLDGLQPDDGENLRYFPSVQQPTMRVYTAQELARLDRECRGFLLAMEQMGVLDTVDRELVIDRVMALDSEDVDLDQLKWVALIVLFNQPGQESSFGWKENLVMDGMGSILH